jgi:hypothetical protein
MNITEIATVPLLNPEPVIVSKSNGLPDISLSELICSAPPDAFTVNVKFWVALGETPFEAVKTRGNAPVWVGVPLRTPALSVTPVGSAPDLVKLGVGVPVAVTVNEPTAPSVKVALTALVMAGACVADALTVNVKFWVALGETPFDAVKMMGNAPVWVGVPLRTPALNVTPVGSAPDSAMLGVGVPVAVTVSEPATPSVKAVLVALVMAGA